jgi:hypothetical protein
MLISWTNVKAGRKPNLRNPEVNCGHLPHGSPSECVLSLVKLACGDDPLKIRPRQRAAQKRYVFGYCSAAVATCVGWIEKGPQAMLTALSFQNIFTRFRLWSHWNFLRQMLSKDDEIFYIDDAITPGHDYEQPSSIIIFSALSIKA